MGYKKAHISRIVNGKTLPSLQLALKIEKFTNGKVKPNTYKLKTQQLQEPK